jgi:nitrilase
VGFAEAGAAAAHPEPQFVTPHYDDDGNLTEYLDAGVLPPDTEKSEEPAESPVAPPRPARPTTDETALSADLRRNGPGRRRYAARMKVAACQFAPVFLDTSTSLAKMLGVLQEAAGAGAEVIAFPETALPGYPGWLSGTGGARFDDDEQKTAFAHYLDAAIEREGPEIAQLTEAARDLRVHLAVGFVERGTVRGRGSTWASLLQVSPSLDPTVHRKLVPTYEERLAWAHGDANELTTHDLPRTSEHRVGALNCWENWMPLARAALYEQGEDVHVSIWPGSPALTKDISRFTAREGRVFVVASSGVLHAKDIPDSFPLKQQWIDAVGSEVLHGGGSRIVAPTGEELAALEEPVEGICYAELDWSVQRAERQNFDVAGHYSRPDLLQLQIRRDMPR